MAILPFLTHHQVFPAQSHNVTALTAIRNLWHVLVFGSRRARDVGGHVIVTGCGRCYGWENTWEICDAKEDAACWARCGEARWGEPGRL